jgi:hypothetical protein
LSRLPVQKTAKKQTETMKTHITLFALITAALIAAPVAGLAKDKDKPAKSAPGAEAAKNRSLPFHGKVASVDAAAMTVTVGSQTLVVTSETKIIKDGKPATIADITAGESARGSYKKDDAGKLNASLISVGEKAPKGESKKKKADK